MPHRIEHLRQTLRELETELNQIEELDDESRELLESAAAEISEALHKEAVEQIEPHTFTERLSEATRQFEESHPTLSRLVGNVINALAQLGI